MTSREEQTARLLVSCFSVAEMLSVLYTVFGAERDWGEQALNLLYDYSDPEPLFESLQWFLPDPDLTSPLEFMRAVVAVLSHQGLMSRELFEEMERRRPNRAEELGTVVELWEEGATYQRALHELPPPVQVELLQFLRERFSPTELRHLLQMVFPKIHDELPAPDRSPEPRFFARVLLILEQRHLIGGAFFAGLARERPIFRETVWRLSEKWAAQREVLLSNPRMMRLCRSFLVSAGLDAQADGAALRLPEPLVIAKQKAPRPEDVHALERLLEPGQRGYFAYAGELPREVEDALDRLRVRGHPIAPLDAASMQAALDDDRCAALLRERRRTYFQQQNLFAMKNAIVDRRFFFGRTRQLHELGSALAVGEHVLLTGLRKVGKTSVLRMLRYHLTEHPWCAVDLQRYRPERQPDWPADVFTKIVAAFDRWGHSRFPDWPTRRGESEEITDGAALEAALQQRRSWQQARGHDARLILVLDEIERVFPTASTGDRIPGFVQLSGALRALGQAGGDRPLAIIAADLRPTVDRVNRLDETTNPFNRFFRVIPLPMLSLDESAEMLRSIGKMMGISEVAEAFSRALVAYSGGHPSLTRLIAAKAYELRADDAALAEPDLQAALTALGEDWELGDYFEENIWGQMTAQERQVLRRIHTQHPDRLRPSRALASLRRQGLIRDGQIALGGLAEWMDVAGALEIASK